MARRGAAERAECMIDGWSVVLDICTTMKQAEQRDSGSQAPSEGCEWVWLRDAHAKLTLQRTLAPIALGQSADTVDGALGRKGGCLQR